MGDTPGASLGDRWYRHDRPSTRASANIPAVAKKYRRECSDISANNGEPYGKQLGFGDATVMPRRGGRKIRKNKSPLSH